MKQPLLWISAGTRRWLFGPLLILTLGVMAILNVVDVPLKTEAAPLGIVSYELAGTVPAARAILDSWAPDARAQAGFSLGLDYLFMLLYATTIGLACVWLAGNLPGFWATAGLGLAWGQGLAALSDALENAALVAMLFGGAQAPWPQIAWACASLKFVLIALALLYLLAGGLVRLIRPTQ